jgi:uncharacterized protein (TIGR01319 family)
VRPRRVLALDCGSTTTKAVLIALRDGVYRLAARAEAPTTVESPFEDVTRGVRNAVAEIEERTGLRLLAPEGDESRLLLEGGGDQGVDLLVATSSAGGGLQMLVAGVMKVITGESAERAALGAGAVVADVISLDDGRLPHERIARIRQLKPDIVLISGGMDGGVISHVVAFGEMLFLSDARPRFANDAALPVIFAGNREAVAHMEAILGERTSFKTVPNLRPDIDREEIEPAAREIQDVFMSHVMTRAPQYHKLQSWVDAGTLPTPGAVGEIMLRLSVARGADLMGVDVGGATTDVFSVIEGVLRRSVSANLGLSYSASNVVMQAGVDNVLRWLPFDLSAAELWNMVGNKTIRPVSLPATWRELLLEQALAREAIRLSVASHGTVACGLKGVQQNRDINDVFAQSLTGQTILDPMAIGIHVGSGGVLSHAPRRAQAALIMLDAMEPRGVTRLLLDSCFVFPHLGVLARHDPEMAWEVLGRDGLVDLGVCVVPAGEGAGGSGGAVIAQALVKRCYRGDSGPGFTEEHTMMVDRVKVVRLGPEEEAELEVRPLRNLDVGAGKGRPLTTRVRGGGIGLILDGRTRPLSLPRDRAARFAALRSWAAALDAYPAPVLARLGEAGGGRHE